MTESACRASVTGASLPSVCKAVLRTSSLESSSRKASTPACSASVAGSKFPRVSTAVLRTGQSESSRLKASTPACCASVAGSSFPNVFNASWRARLSEFSRSSRLMHCARPVARPSHRPLLEASSAKGRILGVSFCCADCSDRLYWANGPKRHFERTGSWESSSLAATACACCARAAGPSRDKRRAGVGAIGRGLEGGCFRASELSGRGSALGIYTFELPSQGDVPGLA